MAALEATEPTTFPTTLAGTGDDNVEKDTRVWFDDGNVILAASGVGFRVHRGVLSAASGVFADMFSMRLTRGEDDEIGDCPVVPMYDSADDLRHLLQILYFGRKYFRPDTCADFAAVASTIRMAHKYQVQDALDDALTRLKTYYTTSLHEWQRVCADGSPALQRPSAAEAIVAVSLARLTDTLSILPAALYACCQVDTGALLRGARLPDGTLVLLEPEDVARCVDARVRIVCASGRIGAQALWLDRRAQTCRTEVCPRARLYARSKILYITPGKECDIFRPRGDVITEMLGEQTEVCAACREQMAQNHEREIAKCWMELPEIMALEVPDWPRSE
ncbi:hypothetical protein CERSUDRAFT_97471 [Gelatoporia subvermispora B]|uniref:BTB domain-containing protein n=1 Tax=Ceriporiopsis subvermispora (strain B) TaxID=914234 RepID=M2R5M4_CERS8|nr:hypothetical protein CERSUDRAFT_97471 [Gelatoporia subvermispora B]